MGPPPGAPPGMRSGGPVRGYAGGDLVRGMPATGSYLLADEYKQWSDLGRRKGSPAQGEVGAEGYKAAVRPGMHREFYPDATMGTLSRVFNPEKLSGAGTDFDRISVGWHGDGREKDGEDAALARESAWAERDRQKELMPHRYGERGGVKDFPQADRRGLIRGLESQQLGRSVASTPAGVAALAKKKELTPEELWAISRPELLGAQQARAAGEAQLVENARTEAAAVAAPPVEPRNFTKEYTDLLDFLDERPKSKGQLAIDAEIEALRKPVSNRSAMFGAMAAAALKGGEHGFAGTMSRVMDARTPFLSSAETQERENRIAVLGALGKQEENRSARDTGALNTIVGMGDKGRDDLHRDLRLKQEYALGIKRINSNVKRCA